MFSRLRIGKKANASIDLVCLSRCLGRVTNLSHWIRTIQSAWSICCSHSLSACVYARHKVSCVCLDVFMSSSKEIDTCRFSCSMHTQMFIKHLSRDLAADDEWRWEEEEAKSKSCCLSICITPVLPRATTTTTRTINFLFFSTQSWIVSNYPKTSLADVSRRRSSTLDRKGRREREKGVPIVHFAFISLVRSIVCWWNMHADLGSLSLDFFPSPSSLFFPLMEKLSSCWTSK